VTRGATATGYGLMSVQGTHTVENIEDVLAHKDNIALGIEPVKPDPDQTVRRAWGSN